MKILLLGEFSSVHNYIERGLKFLNHDVKTISSGDGYKKIRSDISYNVYPVEGTIIKKTIARVRNLLTYVNIGISIKDYDIVQIINPLIFTNYFLNNLLIRITKIRNKKLVLFSGGLDYRYYLSCLEKLEYSPLSWSKEKQHEQFTPTKSWINANLLAEKLSDLIIPAYYSCRIGYLGNPKLYKTIPLPIDTSAYAYRDNIVENKIIIYHGINRSEDKGTVLILEACEIIKQKYTGLVEIITTDKIPLSEYTKMLSECNIYIDACTADAYGISALMAMSLGRITLSGCWKECLDDIGVTESPIVHIGPYVNEIVDRLSELIEKRNFLEHGRFSREYVEKIHDCKVVAAKYIEAWESLF